MKRSTWVAVLATAAILVVAGNLPRLPWDSFAARWRVSVERRVAAWPHRVRHAAAPAVPRSDVAPAPPHRLFVPVAPARLLSTPASAGAPGASLARILPAGVPAAAAAAAIAGALAGLATLAVLLTLSRRDRHARVWRLARRGWSPARIAPRARVPQDAVRTLLTPGLGTRR